MLEEILEEIKKDSGPITVKELALRLDIDEGALKGMLDFLSRKGRLTWGDPSQEYVCVQKTCGSCLYQKSCEIEGKEG